MAATIKLGQVYRPKAFQAHYHVVISNPPQKQGPVLVVNWTTFDDNCIDDACVLNAGDYPTIRHPSTIAYARAHLWRAEKIAFAVANGILDELEPVDAGVLKRIVEGGLKSKELRAEWKAMLPKL